MTAQDLLTSEFATLPDILREQAKERGEKIAVADDRATYSYAELDALMDRIAAALQRDGVEQRQAIAIVSASSINYAAVFLGTLRAGCIAAPLAPSSTPEALAAMIKDCGAPIVFLDGDNQAAIANQPVAAKQVRLDTDEFEAWLAPTGSKPAPVEIRPEDGFNIIYSSGTTGTPKGIVQSHRMRWAHIHRNVEAG